MRLVNREQFLLLPPNTLFMKYAPFWTEDLAIKDENSSSNDFIYSDIVGTGAIDTDVVELVTSDHEYIHLAMLAMGEGKPTGTVSFKIDMTSANRDGCYDNAQLFIVYEQEDIDMLVAKLQTAVGVKFNP